MKNDRNNPIGRPRNAGPENLPIFDSMSALHGATGIPIHVQKKAKAAGCNAFRAGRIYLGDLLRWLFSADEDTETATDWDRLFKKCRAQREQVRLMHERSEVVTRAWVGDLLEKLAGRQRAILEPHVSLEILVEICKQMQPLCDDLVTQGDGGLPQNTK